PVVLREVERAKGAAVALAELGTGNEEERDVGAELCGDRGQGLVCERRRERLVRQPEGRRGVRAAAAEADRDRDLLPDAGRPPRRDTGLLGEALQRRIVRRERAASEGNERRVHVGPGSEDAA